ncbi:unnamed protein product [Heterobilharzia americana]|nr:unnamed protein product [Heterobilharzia americana]
MSSLGALSTPNENKCLTLPSFTFSDSPLSVVQEFIGQLQRAHKRDGTPRESIHESLERLPTLESEAKKSTSSSSAQHFRQEKSDGLSRNSFAPADFTSTSPRHSTVTGGVGGKKNKLGFQFFRPKPVVQSGAKLVQVKELKRMIRAGNQALLNDKYGLALFKDFLSTEFSDENIEFWIACQDYKHTTNPKKLVAKASQIYAEFIAVQANREVSNSLFFSTIYIYICKNVSICLCMDISVY